MVCTANSKNTVQPSIDIQFGQVPWFELFLIVCQKVSSPMLWLLLQRAPIILLRLFFSKIYEYFKFNEIHSIHIDIVG